MDRIRVVGSDGQTLETRPLSPGFGVEKGDIRGRDGEDSVREIGDGEDGILELRSPICLIGLLVISFLELSCLAVIFAYFAALDPGVIFSGNGLVTPFWLAVDLERWLDFAEGVIPGVTRPLDNEGVARPLREGVT